MKLSEISAAVIAKLITEAGTSDFWDEATIKADTNWLYRDTAETLRCLKKRDVTVNSVIGTARYVIPKLAAVDSILSVTKITYDKEPVDYYTTEELDILDYRWRSMDNGLPFGCYFEKGDENVAISFVSPPSDIKEIGFEFTYLPKELADADTPVYPFESGIILIDGVMSMELAKPGGGRDLDRSEFWFGQFTAHFTNLTRHKGFAWHGFRSIDEVPSFAGRRGRLPSNYPSGDSE
jgi:hypothetical protein